MRPPRDLVLPVLVMGWIGTGGLLDHDAGIWQQRAVGVATWLVLLALLRGESRAVRIQVGVVIVVATCVEYTASPLLGLYTYRLHNVPAYVPPGHGMVYLAALSIGRSALADRNRRLFVSAAVALCGLWALWGITLSSRSDVLGAVLFVFLVRFALFGRAPLVYAGAFIVTSYLELVGTGLGAWTWAHHDPSGLLSIGNPPSGIPGGYCFLDAAAMALAPRAARLLERVRPAPVTAIPVLARETR
jgi:hypothetical protein